MSSVTAEFPALPCCEMGGIDVDDRDCEGATLICIDYESTAGQRVPCALCVQDHTNDWTCPMETRELQETRAQCASRAADEELHVALPVETLADPRRFSLTSERYTAYWDGKERVNAVFISRGATPEVARYSREEFARRLATCEAEGKPYDFLECRALTRVPLAQLLLARPGAATVLDVDGAAVQLRRGLVNVLQHLGIRVRLLEEIEAAGVAESAIDAVAAAAGDHSIARAASAGGSVAVAAEVAAAVAAECAEVPAPHLTAVAVADGK